MTDIVIVEDDAVISELIVFNLQNEGYSVRSFPDGKALFEAVSSQELFSSSLFILDIMLPYMDGFEICKRLRADERFSMVPILMLTARGSESDKVKGLGMGADDYLTKPFGMREFMARVQALLRRFRKELAFNEKQALQATGSSINQSGDRETLDAGKLTRPGVISEQNILIDDIKHRVFKDDLEIEMTHREYELLKFLMIHKGVAYSRDDLLNYVWGYEYSGETRTVDVHIRQLRRKLETDDANPVLIETVRGRGYRFCENTDTK